MGYAVEQVWKHKKNATTMIRPYGEMVDTPVYRDNANIQAIREERGNVGRGELPQYRIERYLPCGEWVTCTFRPKSEAGARNFVGDNPCLRVVERQWDGEYLPVRLPGRGPATTKAQPAPTLSGNPKKGLKGSAGMW
jgi:hypothetical protein